MTPWIPAAPHTYLCKSWGFYYKHSRLVDSLLVEPQDDETDALPRHFQSFQDDVPRTSFVIIDEGKTLLEPRGVLNSHADVGV